MVENTITESLIKYSNMITKHVCMGCGAELDTSAGNIQLYPHSGGWNVEGIEGKQWLYVRCHKCKYDWALWKLGVSRQ